MMQSNDYERQVEEINIEVPWGHIAGKWWGSKTVRPILCIHGWQDNCGSFDPLIVQLPDRISYLAIDLPGHGRSSRFADGMIYSLEQYFYTVMLICDHYRWEKVSLMGHSLGAMISFLYAASFPDKCDMVVAFDALRPFSNIFKLVLRRFSKKLRQSIEADDRNRKEQEPPSYTYDELAEKVKSGILIQVNDEAAPYLLQRSVLPSINQRDKYYFSRDSRIKASPIPMMDHSMLVGFARSITSPYCFLRSAVTPHIENAEHYNEIVETMSKNSKFEMHLVGGNHHVHLNEPHSVAGIISKFVDKYRPVMVPSKL